MAWRYTEAGNAFSRPDSEIGIHVDGPLTAEDWKVILQDIVEEMAAKKKGDE